MTEHRSYQVAGHTFILDFPKDILSEKELLPYTPFQTSFCSGKMPIFSLSLTEDADSLTSNGHIYADIKDENGRMSFFMEKEGHHSIYLSSVAERECCRLRTSKDYSSAKAWIGGTERERRYALDTAMMLLFAFSSAKLETILLHASTIEHDNRGYIFLGKSGTGKSTHSRMWIENISGSELLNDDNPIMRIIDDSVYVYGTPWSGKTPCYHNRRVCAGAIIRLHQATVNRIIPIKGISAYATLLPSCSFMRWDHEMAESVHSTIDKIIRKVPVYTLECLPDLHAAKLCFEVSRTVSRNE